MFNGAGAGPFQIGNALQSSRELECLADAVYYEARGETPSGQAAVAQVVMNRVRHPAFPKSICGVVFQGAYNRTGCQFSFACDGSMRRARDIGAEEVVDPVLPAPGHGELGLHRARVVHQIARHDEVRVVLVGEVHEPARGAEAQLAAPVDAVLARSAVPLEASIM